VYIPRMNLIPTNVNASVVFQRRQFPLVMCFALMINKNQGQTLLHVGSYLPRPIFTHGELYVAFCFIYNKDIVVLPVWLLARLMSSIWALLAYSIL
jgi:hypothetical protein